MFLLRIAPPPLPTMGNKGGMSVLAWTSTGTTDYGWTTLTAQGNTVL